MKTGRLMRQQVVSNPAQELFPKSWMAEGAGDNQIRAKRLRFGLQPVGNRVRRNIIDPDRVGRGAVPSEMLDDALPRQGVVRADKVRWIDYEDRCLFRALDKRHGVVERSGGRPARVPGDDDMAAKRLG